MVQIFKRNTLGIALMFCSALMVCFGQLCWKLYHTLGFLYLFCGFILYGMGSIIMILAFRYGRLSVLQPILSISYVFAVIIGYFLLGESLTLNRFAAICLILFGVFLIGGSDE